MTSKEFARLDPEMGYLVLLTRAGLKPLSRWEKALDAQARRAIRREGLYVDTIERRTRIGRRVGETIFARKSRYIDLYRKRFDRTRLRDRAEDARLQGQLFGYPSCCVESFIDFPYTPNGLDPRDQRIMFHWACSSCKTTPGLVREYRRANTIWGNRDYLASRPSGPIPIRKNSAAGKLAASIALAAGTAALAAPTQNLHQAFVLDDADRDGMSVAEELRLGTNWHRADTDGDQVNDGEQLGAKLKYLIDNPAFWLNVYDYAQLGLIRCKACGQNVNMGYLLVENWLFNGLSIEVPYIWLHVMENGCFRYIYRHDAGVSDIAGSVDLANLKRVLIPHLSYPHAIPIRAGDNDGDGLTDAEEDSLGTNPNGGDDGRDLAEDLLDIITQLPRTVHHNRPYMLEHEMDGLEQCEACGSTFNMGMVEIVSPRDQMSVTMPFLALHTMAHGGFAYDGTTNDGEVLPLALRTVLTANGSAHWVALAGDSDDDGLLDSEEAFFGLDTGDPDEDNTQWPDGRELAARMAARISILPAGPLPGEIYVIHHMTHGHYDCLVCGEPVNMGLMEVVDPVTVKTVAVTYYNHHFMQHGSFSTDRDDLYPRVDPTLVGEVVGITSITGVEGSTPAAPFTFKNAPNPFGTTGGTQISLTLPGSGQVELIVYDAAGRQVKKLFSGNASDKELSLRWDGTDDRGQAVAGGVYFCRARFGQVVVSRKMTLVR